MKRQIAGAVAALFTALAGVTTASAQTYFDDMQVLMEMAYSNECHTHDGYGVSIMSISAGNLYSSFDSRFGYADYTEDYGYRTFLDIDHLLNVSPQLQAFIIAHECAHHSLGHSYEAYDKGFVPQSVHHNYERQADCEAIRRIALDHGYRGRDTVSAVFDEMAQVNEQIIRDLPVSDEEKQSILDDLPQRSADRKADGLRCPLY